MACPVLYKIELCISWLPISAMAERPTDRGGFLHSFRREVNDCMRLLKGHSRYCLVIGCLQYILNTTRYLTHCHFYDETKLKIYVKISAIGSIDCANVRCQCQSKSWRLNTIARITEQ